MKTRASFSSAAGLWRSFSTYGKIPTERAWLTAQEPMSRNRASSIRALRRCTCDRRTWRTMGSSSGLLLLLDPNSSHTSKAVSCSVKNVECWYSAFGLLSSSGSWLRHTSAARSHALHSGCWYEGGRRGTETGVQLTLRRSLSARMKLRKMDATRRSWRKSRWKRSGGRRFHAIVSVMAVKIQLSSPSTVLRSLSRPGILSTRSGSMWRRGEDRVQNHLKAILMGVVRQEVNMSAGRSGFWGRSSPVLHAANTMWSSWFVWLLRSTPALEQSKTYIEGLPSQVCRS
mmetsp:Transcript_16622/g.38334  ORF Transcript_16622/g.38334 Transcript_16622/m.38334 type:complete len:286 (+) Transcript_16622:347-1204(+)